MKITTKAAPVKPSRTLRWRRHSTAAGLTGTLTITEGKDVSTYNVEEIGSQFGRGFRVQKLDAAGKPCVARGMANGQYEVCVAGNGQQHCDCPASLLRNTCRHCDACRKIVEIEGIGYPGAVPECCEEAFAYEEDGR